MNRTKHDYIATIMPCYDKKLEAVRQENLGEINIVLGTRELEEMF
jgi:iron only hydrogenase large subunit-like protein